MPRDERVDIGVVAIVIISVKKFDEERRQRTLAENLGIDIEME